MRHLRKDYDAIQPWPVKRPHTAKVDGVTHENVNLSNVVVEPLIPDDEPVFLLRGQDPMAADVVRAYAFNLKIHGGDLEMVRRITDWADEMDAWAKRVEHGLPDVPDGMLR